MKIGIIGSGMIGGTTARLLAGAGHEVAIGNSRGPESLADLVATLGPEAQAVTAEAAARFGEVVLLALPFRALDGLPPADAFAGKIVVDATNPYAPGGGILDLGGRTSSEVVAGHLPADARLVKAFNTLYFETLATGGARQDDRLVLFVAGDDEDAKAVVSGLIEEIGFEPLDTGGLVAGGRRQEPNTAIYNKPLTRAEAETLLRG